MKPFVILGASKTGTSTAVAAANSHPSVFCLFEADFSRPADYGRNEELVALLPSAASLCDSGKSFAQSLAHVDADLRANGWTFDRLGTKVQGIRPDILPRLGDISVLFMVRDVRLWAVKNRVIRDVMTARTATDIVPFLVSYARYFLDSFLIENCLRLPLDRVLSTDLSVLPAAMSGLLGLPQARFERWWQTAPTWKSAAPKNYSTWTQGHTSAFLPPLLADTSSRLAEHPFWNVFLPVFDKYFLKPDASYARSEISQDQQTLDDIARHHGMTLNEGFARFESFKIRNLTRLPDGKLNMEATDRVTESEIEAAADRWQPEPR